MNRTEWFNVISKIIVLLLIPICAYFKIWFLVVIFMISSAWDIIKVVIEYQRGR